MCLEWRMWSWMDQKHFQKVLHQSCHKSSNQSSHVSINQTNTSRIFIDCFISVIFHKQIYIYVVMELFLFSSFSLTLCDTQNKHQNKTYIKKKKHYSYKHHSSTISIFHKQQTYCKTKKVCFYIYSVIWM